jgi:tetratricopeptide (TPR) repeat protein
MNQNDETKEAAAPGEPVPEKPEADLKPADFLNPVKAHLRNGKNKDAFGIMQKAILHFPDDPFILSYYGYLQAQVDKKFRSGVDACKKAITLIRESEIKGKDALYPRLYLNLGRACVAAGKKKDAVEAFRNGLKYDKRNSEIIKQLKELGQRKSPPISFLDRSNPINRMIGMVLHKLKKGPGKDAR